MESHNPFMFQTTNQYYCAMNLSAPVGEIFASRCHEMTPATRRKNSSHPESVEISPTHSSMMTVRTVEAKKPKVPRT